MKAKLPRHVLDAIKDARDAATMKSASFGFPNDTVTADMHMEETKTMHPDEFIKERTRLYRQSWIISRLDRVLEWAEGKKPS